MRQAVPVRLTTIVEVEPGQRLPSRSDLKRWLAGWEEQLPKGSRTSISLMVLAEMPERWQPNLIGFLTRLNAALPARVFSRISASVDVRRERKQPRFIVDCHWVEVQDGPAS
jgi:hypothetical protein